MKIIKTFESFGDELLIGDLCEEYNIQNYTINSDGSIDVDGNVDLCSCGLTEIPLTFNRVSGNFEIVDNKLESLEGSPREVGGDFNCIDNKLTTLEGAPESVGDLICDDNNLISLKGCPKEIIGYISICRNEVTSFDGLPDKISKTLICSGNPIYELWKLFEDYKHIELFNDLDITRDNKVIILDRLNDFLDMIGKPKVTEVKGYKCI